MEKIPDFRTIGSASLEHKEKIRDELVEKLFSHFESLSPEDQKILEKQEYPKTEVELALIGFANRETSRLMQDADVEPHDIPEENYHIIPTELYEKIAGEGSSATAKSTEQGIIFDAAEVRGNAVYFGAVALHETLHLKARLVMEVSGNEDKISATPYREGVSIRALQKQGYHGEYHTHFDGLHEAIVAETEKRFLGKLLDEPQLSKEKEWLETKEAKDLKKKISEIKGVPEEDIVWVGEGGDNDWERVGYSSQRMVLSYLCDEIHKEFSGEYKSPDEVYKVFLNAHFTGRLLSIARLIEKTFGEGSFRLLGNMETDKVSGLKHLDSLKKERMRFLRDK